MKSSRHYDKDWWRKLNALTVRRLPLKCPNQTLLVKGKLRGRVLDLAGEDTKNVYLAYKDLLPDPSKLLLVDRCAETLFRAYQGIEDLHNQPRVICHPDAFNLVYAISQDTHERDEEERVGVFSLDLLNSAGEPWWIKYGDRFMKLAIRPAVDAFNACVLILNHTLDGRDGHKKAAERLEGHIECLRQALRAFNCDKEIQRKEFLPSPYDVQQAVANHDFLGWLGQVQIYLSRTLRMVTIRLYIQPNKFHLVREKDLA